MQLITPADAAGRVTAALQSAAQATGAGFDYLLKTAKRESSLDPTAQAPTSSARGLFQFLDQTWLEVLKEEGPKLGMADAAADVTRTASGKYKVADPERRAELLALRDDPHAAALLAGAFTRRNAAAFSSAVGRQPTEGELYVAHFLGAQGAVDLTTLAAQSPSAPAASAFPAQAAANRAIFFDNGRARSASEVYGRLTSPGAAAGVETGPTPSSRVAAAMQAIQAEDVRPYNGGVENDQTAFHSMFKTGRRSPVSAYVAQAWSGFGAAGIAADATAADAGRKVARTPAPAIAQAYAADPAPIAKTPASVAAADAVRKVVTKREIARPPAAQVAVAAAPVEAAPPVPAAEPRFDVGTFLRNALSAPTPASSPIRSGRP